MGLKSYLKPLLVKVACSSFGPVIQDILRGMGDIVDMHAGREFRRSMNEKLSVSSLVNNDNLIKEKRVISQNTDKIKIRFFHCSANTFNVIQTVCENFKNDPNYDLLIVLFGYSYTPMMKQMEQLGYNYIADYDYNLQSDKPDISIIYHLEISYPPQLTHIREYSSYVALVPLSIGSIWFGDRTVSRMNLERYNADMCCIGNLCYERLIPVIGDDKIERISPAQFDLSYRVFNKETVYPAGWEKLKGKKTVMYMTDHGLRQNLISDEVSFDLYFKDLINYYKEHTGEGLILRLHFALVRELVSTYWSLEDYHSFVSFCNNSPNIVWDVTDDYLIGLKIADGCMVDVNCSLVYFSLAANKPIAVPLRNDMRVEVNNPELVDKYYKIQSSDDLFQFLENIKNGNDPLKDERQELIDKYIETFDGNNGVRIAEIIKKRFEKFNAN